MRWLRTMKLLLVVLLALGANAGCDDLNCFDGAGLEAKYNEGADIAAAENAAQFEQGKTFGLSLTRADGEREGAAAGYSDGYSAGYNSPDGYDAGYQDAYDEGSSDGAFDGSACSSGTSDGYSDGRSDGYDDAYSDGYSEGYSDGESSGASDGEAACEAPEVARVAGGGTTGSLALVKNRMKSTPSIAPQPEDHADDVDPEEARVCYKRGYDDSYDYLAYERGVSEGKRLNPEYQAGFRSTYDAAYAAGVLDGIDAGYRDGSIDGYDDGYDDGGSDGYDAGYDDGYSNGYDDGWSSVTCE